MPFSNVKAAYEAGIPCQMMPRSRNEWEDLVQGTVFTFKDEGAQYRVRPEYAGFKLVGTTDRMPGTDGFTLAVFNASEVPVGTRIFIKEA